jgi:hypothetical protein
MAMQQPLKETVIVVHGTWAAPVTDRLNWYNSGSDTDGFVSKLNSALQARGSSARCWAHCVGLGEAFHWTGENSWVARTRGAESLAEYVTRLRNNGWCCHLVAHSHGGNVVVEALYKIARSLGGYEHIGKIVTLGTPFIDLITPAIEKDGRRQEAIFKMSTWFAVILTCNTLLNWARQGFHLAVLTLLLFPAILFLAALAYRGRNVRISNRHPSRSAVTTPQLLALGSRMDEVWQILHHMGQIDNPLAVKAKLFWYLVSSLRSTLEQRKALDRLYNGSLRDIGFGPSLFALAAYCLLIMVFYVTWTIWRPTDYFAIAIVVAITLLGTILVVLTLVLLFGHRFILALLIPVRWFGRIGGAFAGVAVAIGTYIVRRAGWSVVLRIAMGLEGYQFQLPKIAQWPNQLGEDFARYEDMPPDAEKLALKARNAWLERHIQSTSVTFANASLTSMDVSTLIREVEADQELVHAAYYTNNECIERIADWIAGIR